jgi:XisI protein
MADITHERIDIAALAEITRREVEMYAGYSPTAKLYPVLDDQNLTYAVVIVPNWPRPFSSEIVVLARIVAESIVIEEDTTDKPLLDALMVNGGIPREQIVLAYAGETYHQAETNS